MNRNESAVPRAAFGMVAVGLAALTVTLLVFVPTQRAVRPETATTAARTQAPTIMEVTIRPGRIDVVAAHEPVTLALKTAMSN